MKLKYFPWLIGFLLLVVIVLASFPAPALIQFEAGEMENKVTYNAPFTLHFSQIMKRDTVEKAFQLIPETKGAFKWKDLKTLEFYPEEDLSIGDRYRIIIGSEAKSLWMKKMGYDAAVEYLVTGPPYVLFADPNEDSILKKDGVITVMFDRAMDLGGIDEEDLIEIKPELEGDIRLVGMSAFQFIPNTVSTGKKYQFVIPAGLVARDGGVTAEDYSWEVSTPSLSVVQSDPGDEAALVELEQALEITFNSEASLGGIKPGVNALLYPSNDLDADVSEKMDGFFNTEVTYKVDEAGESQKSSFVFTPTFPYQPDTEYRFVLKADTDLQLEEDFEISFKTIEPLQDDEVPDEELEDSVELATEPTPDAESFWKNVGMEFFIRGEHPRLELKEALSEPGTLEACQVSSNEFMRVSAAQGWNDFNCEEDGEVINPVQKNDGLTINLNDYFQYKWVTGVYFASLTQGKEKHIKLFLIEDSTLLLKRSDQDLFVWALDTKSGEPIADMQLEILDYHGGVLAEGATNEAGVFSINKAFDQGIYVRGKTEGDISRWAFVSDQWVLDSTHSASDSDHSGLYVILNQTEFLPGDQIEVKGVWRDLDDQLLSLPAATQATVTIEDVAGNFVLSKRVPLRRNGSFDVSLPLPEDSLPGLYYVAISDLNHQKLTKPLPVSIKEGLSPVELDWVEAKADYAANITPVLLAKARYKNGLPIAQLQGHYDLYRRPYELSYEDGAIRYSFGEAKASCSSDCHEDTLVTSDTLSFDFDGEAKLLLTDGNEGFLPPGFEYVLALSDEEEGASLLHSFKVHSGTYDLGLGLKHYIIGPGQDIEGSIVTLDHRGELAAENKVKVSLLSLKNEKRKLNETSLSTDLTPSGFLFPVTPEMEDGPYLIRAESLDDEHNKLISEQTIYVDTNPLLALDDELMLASDQDKYFVGGRAHMLINEPNASEDNPVPVVVTYERGGLLGYETLTLTEPTTRHAVPIKEAMFPHFVVTVTHFNRGVSPFFSSTSRRIDVGYDESQIFLDIDYEPRLPEPGEIVTLKLHTYDYQNRSVPAVVTLNVQDHLPKQEDFSYRSFFPPLYSLMSQASNISLREPDYGPAYESVPVYIANPTESVYFDPLVTTDEVGKAEVMFTLPDQGGDLFVQAFATRGTAQFGLASETIRMHQNLQLEAILPSFVVPGDQTTFAALVRNVSDVPVQSRLTLLSPDTAIKGDSSRNFSLQPGQQTEIAFSVYVDKSLDKESLDISFEWEEGDLKTSLPLSHLASKVKLPSDGIIDDIWTGHLSFPKNAHAGLGQLQLLMGGSPMIAAEIQRGRLDALTHESTFSLATKLIVLLTLNNESDSEEDPIAAKELTSSLLKRADLNGSYRFWSEPSANPVLTAMVLFAYKEASSQGIHVDSLQLNKTISFLWNTLNNGSSTLTLDDELLILWILGLHEQYDTELALEYFQQRGALSTTGKAFLLMNLNDLIEAGQKSAMPLFETLKSELVDDAVSEGGKVHFDGSAESTAVVLYALNEISSNNPLLKPMADYLATSSSLGFSPKEALWVLVALSRYTNELALTEANFIAQVKLNGALVMDQSVTGKTVNDVFETTVSADTFSKESVNDLFVKKEGSGTLYFDAYLTSHLDPSMVDPLEEGVIILRELYELNDEGKKSAVGALQKGHYYVSELELIVPEDYSYVALTDAIPAGMRVASATLEGPFVQHFTEAEGITYYAPHLPAGVYTLKTVLQAILPGTYLCLPATMQPIFEPNVLGRTQGETIQIID